MFPWQPGRCWASGWPPQCLDTSPSAQQQEQYCSYPMLPYFTSHQHGMQHGMVYVARPAGSIVGPTFLPQWPVLMPLHALNQGHLLQGPGKEYGGQEEAVQRRQCHQRHSKRNPMDARHTPAQHACARSPGCRARKTGQASQNAPLTDSKQGASLRLLQTKPGGTKSGHAFKANQPGSEPEPVQARVSERSRRSRSGMPLKSGPDRALDRGGGYNPFPQHARQRSSSNLAGRRLSTIQAEAEHRSELREPVPKLDDSNAGPGEADAEENRMAPEQGKEGSLSRLEKQPDQKLKASGVGKQAPLSVCCSPDAQVLLKPQPEICAPPGSSPKWGKQASSASAQESKVRERARKLPCPPCAYFLKTGECGFGQLCRFSHPEAMRPQFTSEKLPIRPGEIECPFHQRYSWCGFGKACKYHHREPSTAPATQGQGEKPVATSEGEADSVLGPRPSAVATNDAQASVEDCGCPQNAKKEAVAEAHARKSEVCSHGCEAGLLLRLLS